MLPPFTWVMASLVGVGSPTAKSLNELMPVAWVDVAVLVPFVVVFQDDPSQRCTMKFEVLAPGSTSPATKLNVALYVVNVIPELVSVQYLFTSKFELMPELAMFGCSLAVVVAVRLPPTETLANVRLTGV